ncbi:MAG: AmmeMemoRadiSam system protein B [Chloroflexi bacterium]|nr:AmmeMemoRadiSam system protein B [Chloroflexota bacterium]
MFQALPTVRPSPLSGQWYPADPQALAALVDRLLAEGAARLPPLSGEILGLVAPHAGIRYSGPVAGTAFAAVQGRTYRYVAVLGPMHHVHPAPILTTAHQAYATPLGLVPVASEALQVLDATLRAHLGYGLTPVARDPEHSLEMELIFLQRALAAEFQLLPLMFRTVDPRELEIVGQALAQLLDPAQDLIVASSDLSHYFPQPVAQRLDQEMLRRILALDPLAVLLAEEEGVGQACGRAAIATMLWATRAWGATRAQLLHYATSGDVTGDYDAVVGYAAVAVLR